jgi:hypothetical protein
MQTASSFLKRYGPIIGFGIIIWLVFNQAVYFGFLLWDDNIHITDNPYLQGPLWQWPKILWIFQLNTSMRFEPVTWLAHLLICSLFTINAGVYHFCLIVLHFINSILVYKLCCRVLGKFKDNGLPTETIAFVATAFWAIDAVRAESLGRCTDISYPLATLFVLGSFGFYLGSFDKSALRPGPYTWSFILNGIAVCTYPIALGFGFCLPFFDRIFFPLETEHRWNIRATGFFTYWSSRFFFILPSVAVGWVTVRARLHPSGGYAPFIYKSTPFNPFRLVHAIYAWAYIYLHQFWPFDLTPAQYPWPDLGFHRVYLFAFFCLAAVLALAWRQRSPAILAGLAASLCLLGPMLGLSEAPITPVDRYTYLPNAFFTLLLAWGVARWWLRSACPAATAARITLGLGFILLPLMGLQSRRQLQIWQSTYTLLSYIEATTPGIKSDSGFQDFLTNKRAAQLILDGKPDAALPIYKDLVRHQPGNCYYWHHLGLSLYLLGHYEESLRALQIAYTLCHDPITGQLIQHIQSLYPPKKDAPAASIAVHGQ